MHAQTARVIYNLLRDMPTDEEYRHYCRDLLALISIA